MMTPDELREHPSFGSFAAIAVACDLTRQATNKWAKIPLEHCPAIERYAKGLLRCEKMRSDVHWLRSPKGVVIGYTVYVNKHFRRVYARAA